MASISDYLKNILAARYGKDVRQSIHDAIQQCYYDGKAGSIDLEARQSIEDLDNNKLDKTGDSASNTVTFTSGDSTSPTGWADIVAVASGETHASLFRKFSLAVKNLRYLYKMLGSTDISAIGDGTVTGVLSFLKSSIDTTNSNLNIKSGYLTSDYSNKSIVYEYNSFMAMIFIDGLKNIEKNKQVTIATLPEGARPGGIRVVDISNTEGAFVRLTILANGDVIVYNYTDINLGNIVESFTYMK